MKWPVIKLRELQRKSRGSLDPSKFPNESFTLYSIPAYDGGKPQILKGCEIGSSKQLVTNGDILISKIVPHIRRAWVVNDSYGNRQIASGEWIVFNSEKVLPNFFRQFLISDAFHQKFMQTVAGVGGSLLRAQPRLVADFNFSLPPLEEQQRIAKQLDTADRILRLREASIAKLDQLAQSVFVDMFGADKSNNKNWSRAKLGSLCDIEWGNTSITKASYIDNGIPAFSASGQDGFLAEAEHNGKGIVLSAIGARCGKCFKASGEWTAIKNTITIKSKSDQIDIDFLYQILNDEKSWDVRGAGQPFITLATARSREIIVPPIQLQIRFADFINELVHRRTEFEVSRRHLLALNRSLQNKSFSVN